MPLKFLQETLVKNIEIIVCLFILYPPHICHNQETIPDPPRPPLWCAFAVHLGAARLLLKPQTISLLLLLLNPQIKDETKGHSFFFFFFLIVPIQTPPTFQDLGSHFSFLFFPSSLSKKKSNEKNVLRWGLKQKGSWPCCPLILTTAINSLTLPGRICLVEPIAPRADTQRGRHRHGVLFGTGASLRHEWRLLFVLPESGSTNAEFNCQ